MKLIPNDYTKLVGTTWVWKWAVRRKQDWKIEIVGVKEDRVVFKVTYRFATQPSLPSCNIEVFFKNVVKYEDNS